MFERTQMVGEGRCARESCGEALTAGDEITRVHLPHARGGAVTIVWHPECHAAELAEARDRADEDASRLGTSIWSPKAPAFEPSDFGAMRDRVHA